MTKNEALKAVIEGKQVRCTSWKEGDAMQKNYVDFATAWKAYEEGRKIASCLHITVDEIRGKWLILEEE